MFVELKKAFLGRAAGERIDVSETDAQQLIQQQTAVAVDDDLIGPAVTRALDAALARQSQSIDAAVNQSLKAFADARSLSRKHAAPLLFGAGGDGDPHGKTFGDWALAVARGDRNYLEKHYGSRFVEYAGKAALAEASGVTGGYTMPPDFYQQLMSIMAEETFVRPRAFVVPMASATMQIPYLDVSTVQSAGVSPFFGGVQMYWTAEAQTRTETEPQFKQLDLKAWELSGYSVSSNVLLQDSVIGLEKFLMTLFAKSLAWFEEYAFLQGNGASKPQGMLGAAATVSQTRQTGNQVQYADVAGMWAKLLPISWGKAFWTCSPSVVPQLLQLKDGFFISCVIVVALAGWAVAVRWRCITDKRTRTRRKRTKKELTVSCGIPRAVPASAASPGRWGCLLYLLWMALLIGATVFALLTLNKRLERKPPSAMLARASALPGTATICPPRDTVTEQEWLECTDPRPMLEFVRSKASDRKLRLFACACLRRIWHLLEDMRSRRVVEVAESFADRQVSRQSLATAEAEASAAAVEREGYAAYAAAYVAQPDMTVDQVMDSVAGTVVYVWEWEVNDDGSLQQGPGLRQHSTKRGVEQRRAQAFILREIYNPFSPTSVPFAWLSWNDATVPKLAQVIYNKRTFDRLPVLADALEEAGCTSADILTHCRNEGPHVRGCWVVDLLLGKE